MFNSENCLKDICDIFSLDNFTTEPTYFYKDGNSLIDVMLTNKENRFLNHGCVNTHLSDGHLFVYRILKQTAPPLVILFPTEVIKI